MRVLVQRVSAANVVVNGATTGAIGNGLLLLVGVTHDDSEAIEDRMADKIVKLRIFSDDAGLMNRSVLDVGGEILAVSQFTLYADARKGNRPSYTDAARPEQASPAFDRFVGKLAARLGKPVPTGIFGADMKVSLTNDGPVTIWLDSAVL
ncbi:D-aminoacyl-tRNA deacylase [Casimicrobium huifangae]|jgi:D-tyrosyl-tRNA(Tyr) deacylase|uniref:D-aminoacyl-tRNA deacylase n=1 Tax=Casimicrobium huifangae TaxID=2591109 RepID=UPI0012EB67B3|nr:D-aminoacyl-tRNA deacylase [Casimicrobium huifangae]